MWSRGPVAPTARARAPRGPAACPCLWGVEGPGPVHLDDDVAVLALPARRSAPLVVVEGELAGDRREPRDRAARPARRGPRRPLVVEDREHQRERAVVVSHELDQARLLRPVDVRRGRDLPEAVRPLARVLAAVLVHGVLVLVAVHVREKVRAAAEQVLERLDGVRADGAGGGGPAGGKPPGG